MAKSFISRAMDIMRQPQAEWRVVAGEDTRQGALMTGYALPWLALASAVGFLLGRSVSIVGGGEDVGGTATGTRIALALFGILFGLVVLWLQIGATRYLSNANGGSADIHAAARLAVYSQTPVWLAGLFGAVPAIGVFLPLLGLVFGIVLYAYGATPVLGVPDDRVFAFTAFSVLVWALITVLAGVVMVMVIYPTLFGIDILGQVMAQAEAQAAAAQ